MGKIRTRGRLTVLGALVLLTSCCPSAPEPSSLTGTIIVGVVADSPGFSVGFINPAGFDIGLMRAIGSTLHTQVTSTPLTIAEREPKLQHKNVTLTIATYSITTSRNQDGIDFAGPYMVTPQAFLIRADDTSISTDKDLKGKRVCTQKEGTGANVTIQGADMGTKPDTTEKCVDLLSKGDVDAVFTDELVLYGYTEARKGEFKVILPGDFGELQYYGIGLLGNHHADCLKLNDAINDYLRIQWRSDFKSTLQDAITAHPPDSNGGDFESHFKPSDSDQATLSCKL